MVCSQQIKKIGSKSVNLFVRTKIDLSQSLHCLQAESVIKRNHGTLIDDSKQPGSLVLGNDLGDREIAVLCNVGMGEQIMN